jgi:hypothetical protein
MQFSPFPCHLVPMKIYHSYFVTVRISTWHIKNMINWNVLTWRHICKPMNQDMTCKDVLIVTIYTYYCSQFVYLSKSQNGTLLLYNSSQSYVPHKHCDCSNTALYYSILHCPQWLTQAELPHNLVWNDSFESKSGKRRDEISLWMQWHSWLRHCATSRKVMGLIPSRRILVLWLTRPLTEMSTENISFEDSGGRCIRLTTLPPSCADCLKIWEPQPPGTLRACNTPVQDLLDISYMHSILPNKFTAQLTQLNSH